MKAHRRLTVDPQIDKTSEDNFIHWQDVVPSIRALGDRVASLVEDGVVSTAELDIGLPCYDSHKVSPVTMPAELCEVAGRNPIAVTTTHYLPSKDEEPDEVGTR